MYSKNQIHKLKQLQRDNIQLTHHLRIENQRLKQELSKMVLYNKLLLNNNNKHHEILKNIKSHLKKI